jgi:Flp pilus assembly protein TadG
MSCDRHGPRCAARHSRNGAQTLVELAFCVVLIVMLAMGIIEFGRAWMIANMITHAARDGARAAAVTPVSKRNSSGIITDSTTIANIKNIVRDRIATVMDPSTIGTIDLAQPTIDGIPMVQVTVNGTLPYLFGFFGSGETLGRSVTFRDEGR